MALQTWCSEWHEMGFDDTDLQRVVMTWNDLAATVKAAISALVNSPKGGIE
jgi:hypothetical protein